MAVATFDRERCLMSKSHQCGNVQENIEDEPVSAKSKPVRGLCLLKRNDGPEAVKEDGRNEDYLGNTAWGNIM